MLKITKNLQIALTVSLLSILTLISSCAKTAPRPPANFHIVLGVGLANCKIGDVEMVFRRVFSGTIPNGQFGLTGYLVSPTDGVDAYLTDGKIVTLFFHFSSPGYSVFDGEMLEGIGRHSTPDDVIRTYGKPEIALEGPGLLVSSTTWTQERSLKYPSKGFTVTFQDGRIADIRIYKSRNPR